MSCSTPRQLAKSDQESQVNKDLQSRVDSITQSIVETNINELLEKIEQIETEIVVFDTDKPLVDSTGLPPVKVIVKQTASTEEKQTTTQQQAQDSETKVEKETSDQSVEKETVKTKVQEKTSWWETFKQHLMRILLIPIIFFVIWVVYKAVKLLK